MNGERMSRNTSYLHDERRAAIGTERYNKEVGLRKRPGRPETNRVP